MKKLKKTTYTPTIKSLVFAVSTALMATATAHAKTKAIGDLEIYEAAKGGAAVLTMMLDISGSMGACDYNGRQYSTTNISTFRTYTLKDANGNTITKIKHDDGTEENISGKVQVYMRQCTPTINRQQIVLVDRLATLKDAILNLVSDSNNLSEDYRMGVGVYSDVRYSTSRILVPAHKLTDAHRWRIMQEVAKLSSGGRTPTALAYSDAAAYMFGTATGDLSDTVSARYIPKMVANWTPSVSKWNLNMVYGSYYGPNATGLMTPLSTNPVTSIYPYPDGWFVDQYNNTFTSTPYISQLDPSFFVNATHAITTGSSLATCVAQGMGAPRVIELVNGRIPTSVSINPTCDTSVTFAQEIKGYRRTTPADDRPGIQWSVADSKKADGKTYDSPIKDDECNGNGIYFLTDGAPNDGDNAIATYMGRALNSAFSYDTVMPDETGSAGDRSWTAVASFAKRLNSTNNPLGQPIKTATVGFGYEFHQNSTSTVTKIVDGEEVQVTNCDALNSADARNLCRWGERGYGYGEGGFLATSDSEALKNNVISFAKSLQTEIPPSISGTISIPDDPYSISAQQAIAYMPTIEARASDKDTIWPGNLKKYTLDAGTPYGKRASSSGTYEKVRLYKDDGSLNSNVQDLWSNSASGNDLVTVGGVYSHLASPNTTVNNVRTVYVEDTGADGKPVLRQFGVNTQGHIILDGQRYSATNDFRDRATYTSTNVKYLLKFLGFDTATVNAISNLYAATLTRQAQEIKVMGASPHSVPALLSYKGTIDANSQVTSREDYLVYGSMDGALHVVDAKDASDGGGTEKFAFIPKVMIQTQPSALERGSQDAVNTGYPKFGVDAPWHVAASYEADYQQSAMVPSEDIYAYGGLRLGGEGLYGLNLGKSSSTTPTLAFALTPNTAGFGRLGQIWSKPVSAKIRDAQGNAKDVLIFGGGYDLCYENAEFQVDLSGSYGIASNQRGESCNAKTQAVGNAVYMVDAKTGSLIWSASNSSNTEGASTTHSDIKHSIVGEVNTIDRNGDGYIDAIYFADLGGQIFRADATSTSNGIPNRVTRILKRDSEVVSKYVRRFYEKPVLSVYSDSSYNGGRRFVLINAISGDRSNPTSTMRETQANADRVYGIMDTDIGLSNADFYGDNATLSVKDVSSSTLEDLSSAITTDNTKEKKIENVKSKKGWYYPLSYFDGYTNVKYTKGIGKSEVISSLLYTSVYNPDKSYGETNACVSSIIGGSEYQMYCLPFGVCMSDSSKNGRGGFLSAGQGIRELTLGPVSDTATGRNQRVLISSVAVNESLVGENGSVSNRIDYGEGVSDSSLKNQSSDTTATGGDGSMPIILFDSRFVMQPQRWYDNSTKSN
ncbi:MAG: hypothetical protein Q4B79_01840 [Moraxella sp.]|uniref:hypothetical protein n=1 Tax=Moraxella sp. TaxID=479 RepID=UPI0026DB7895|nr:hypothetical protein [Moraxella sp.]MDO4449684.1 hypothetical protein [Moraxella sp.]